MTNSFACCLGFMTLGGDLGPIINSSAQAGFETGLSKNLFNDVLHFRGIFDSLCYIKQKLLAMLLNLPNNGMSLDTLSRVTLLSFSV